MVSWKTNEQQRTKEKNNVDQSKIIKFSLFSVSSKIRKKCSIIVLYKLYIVTLEPSIFLAQHCAKWGGEYNNSGENFITAFGVFRDNSSAGAQRGGMCKGVSNGTRVPEWRWRVRCQGHGSGGYNAHIADQNVFIREAIRCCLRQWFSILTGYQNHPYRLFERRKACLIKISDSGVQTPFYFFNASPISLRQSQC